MKNLIISLFIFLSSVVSQAQSASVQVGGEDASVLFQAMANAGLRVIEDTQNRILHADVMMCSLYLKMGSAPQFARCLLPNEQVIVDKENAVVVATLLKKYEMPSSNQMGYEKIQAGLDCVFPLAGVEHPACVLTAK